MKTPCSAKDFFKLFFDELERRNIPYVILHSYQNFPDRIASDVDYAVPDAHLPKLRGIQMELAWQHGWALVQTLRHGVFAYYAVLVSKENPAETLRLDACSNYARARRFLVPESVLLANRRLERGFYVPSPSGEFIYVLAKIFDAKNKSPANYLPRLRELWQQEPEKAQKNFAMVFGETGRSLKEWFDMPAEEWHRLRPLMMERNRFGAGLMLREGLRVVARIFHPTGICVAVLGSDGAGKSTLLANLEKLLEPCFRYRQTFHFRPAVLEKKKTGVVTDPHGQSPRGLAASWMKVGYYFADHWLGWMTRVWPAKVRSTLIIFDRSFDDLVVDQRRYRLKGSVGLTSLLRKFVPRADRTFVLSAPAALLHERKPELSLVELERQQEALQRLARGGRYVLVSAAEAPQEVAFKVWRELISIMSAREARRNKRSGG